MPGLSLGGFHGLISTGIECQERSWSVEEVEGAPSAQQGARSKYSPTWPLRHTYKFKEGTDVHECKGWAVLDAKTSPLLDYICQKQIVRGIYFIPPYASPPEETRCFTKVVNSTGLKRQERKKKKQQSKHSISSCFGV